MRSLGVLKQDILSQISQSVSGGYRIIIKKNGITKKGEAVYKTKDEVIDKMWELFEFFYNKYGKET